MDEGTLLLDVGKAIRGFRVELGLSQEALADKIRMHRAYYSAIERGERNITLATLYRVAGGLGAAPSEILAAAGI